MFFNNTIRSLLSSIIVWIVVFELISAAIGFSTRSGMYPWYTDLKKSSLTPPGYIFSIVWPLLYFSLAIFGYRLYKKSIDLSINILFKLYGTVKLFRNLTI